MINFKKSHPRKKEEKKEEENALESLKETHASLVCKHQCVSGSDI